MGDDMVWSSWQHEAARSGAGAGVATCSEHNVYGGQSGTAAEVAYYQAFGLKYARITQWHLELQREVLRTGCITLPTGRQYAFPGVKRTTYGVTNATQIKNYPVQGYATADIVPIAMLLLHRYMKLHKVKSLLINTVHDSVVVDVYPGEEQLMCRLMYDAFMAVPQELFRRYRVRFKTPLEVELKLGPNWLTMKEVDVSTLPAAAYHVETILSPQRDDPDGLDDDLPI